MFWCVTSISVMRTRGNDYYSYEVIWNNFYIYCCNLSFDFVNYFLICFGNYHLIFVNLIYYMSYSVICCLDNFDFDCLSNFFSYCLNSFCFYCTMSFVIGCWNSVYFLGLNGNWMHKQIVLSLNSIVDSCFDYLIDYIYFREFLCSGDLHL